MNGSSDTPRFREAPALLDDLPPGIAWLRGPHSPPAGGSQSGRPELRRPHSPPPGGEQPSLLELRGQHSPPPGGELPSLLELRGAHRGLPAGEQSDPPELRGGHPRPTADEQPDPPQQRGPHPRPPAGERSDLPELRPGQVVTWLPDGRWVTDPDELDAGEHHDNAAPVRVAIAEHRRPGRDGSQRGRPGPGRRRADATSARRDSERAEWASGRRGPEPAERVRRWGRRRVRLARVGARLAGWPRRVVVGMLLVVAAVLALRPEGAPAPAAGAGATQHVVVAARDLGAGRELAAADLRVVSMPVEIVPSGSSPRAGGLIGRIAAGAIRRGEALTDARLIGPGLAAGLGPDESAAVPVRIADPDAAVLVRVGDRVDVLGTPVAPDGTQATAGETVTVASAVRVLALLRSRDPADGVVLVVATGEAAARTLAGAAVRHRLTVNVRPP